MTSIAAHSLRTRGAGLDHALVANVAGRLDVRAPIASTLLGNLGTSKVDAPVRSSLLANIGRLGIDAPVARSGVASIGDAHIGGLGLVDSLVANIGSLNITGLLTNSIVGNLGRLNIDAPVTNSIIGNLGKLSLTSPVTDSIVGNLGGTIVAKRSAGTNSSTGRGRYVGQQSAPVDPARGARTQLPKYPGIAITARGDQDLSGYDLSDVRFVTNFGGHLTVNDTLPDHVLITNTGTLSIAGATSIADKWISNLGGTIEIG